MSVAPPSHRGPVADPPDERPIGAPASFGRRQPPPGRALDDPEVARALAAYRGHAWVWLLVGAVTLGALVLLAPRALPDHGAETLMSKLWFEALSVGVVCVVAGITVLRRAAAWRTLLAAEPWREYRARFIPAKGRRGVSGIELTAVDAPETTPALLALGAHLPVRRAHLNRETVWVVGPLGGHSLIAAPGRTLELFAGCWPTGRTAERLRAAQARASTTLRPRSRRRLLVLRVGLALLHVGVLVYIAVHPLPGPDGPVPVPAGQGGVAPTPGTYTADGVILSSTRISNLSTGEQLSRTWAVQQRCSTATSCALWFVLPVEGGVQTAQLVPDGALWSVTLPPDPQVCIEDGVTSSWSAHRRLLLRFSAAGTVSAGERDYLSGPECGSGLLTAQLQGAMEPGTSTAAP